MFFFRFNRNSVWSSMSDICIRNKLNHTFAASFQFNKIICFLWMEYSDEFTYFNINYYLHKWAAKYFCRFQQKSNQYYINDFIIIWFFCNQIEKIILNCLNLFFLRTKSIHFGWMNISWGKRIFVSIEMKYQRLWSWVNWIMMLLSELKSVACTFFFVKQIVPFSDV